MGLVLPIDHPNGYSHYIVAWKPCTRMKVDDIADTLNLALAASGCDKVEVEHRPRLLSDNGPCYVASDLGEWLQDRSGPQRSRPSADTEQDRTLAPDAQEPHPTGKLFLSRGLEAQIAAFVEHCNHRRYHESLDNLAPADAYFRRDRLSCSNAKPSDNAA